MKTIFLFALGLACAPMVFSQEIVTVPTRAGVTQSFFIAAMEGRKPEAAALLFIGGGGNIGLRMENGQIRFAAGNFLPRSRREFIRNGILPLILDSPSDLQGGMSDDFRESAEHAADIRAVVGEVKKRYPGLPLFLVGTSRGTLSVARLAGPLQGEIGGAALTSSYFFEGSRNRPRGLLDRFDWSKIRVPLLFVHHEADECWATPFKSAAHLARQYPLVWVRGGLPAKSGPCDPLSAHGFYGKEAETVDAIARWMLGKPYTREIR